MVEDYSTGGDIPDLQVGEEGSSAISDRRALA